MYTHGFCELEERRFVELDKLLLLKTRLCKHYISPMKNLHWCDYLESGYLKENLTWGMIPMTYISSVCIHYISTHVTMEQPIKT